ncbi:transposase [Bradyrhizobium sp. CCBAU 11386]|uniref:transposase n=1 Tax=Bradyrhizobium sp. CCBAU 11386 TaxID=1630837 RepID=UPI003FA497F0
MVLESLQAARQVAATARRYGVSRSLLLRWRRSFRPEPKDAAHQTGFVPAMVVAESGPTPWCTTFCCLSLAREASLVDNG